MRTAFGASIVRECVIVLVAAGARERDGGAVIATVGMRTMVDLQARRPLGRTSIFVGPLSFGGNALSNLYAVVDEAQADSGWLAQVRP